jgi:DNA-binding MarR family transcriptional regulator
MYIALRYTQFMSKRKESTIDYEALAEFRYEVRRFLHFAERAARAAGIEPQQYQALLTIRGLPARARATIGTLAERMQIRHHSAVELSGRLERAGWIGRSRGDVDRREVLLQLTGRGENLLENLSQLHRRELRTAAPKLIEALRCMVARDGESRDKPKSKRGGHKAQVAQRARKSRKVA